ncbi:MAG: hypothetical protein K9L02_02135 [Acholeplasmataceae bacterium]|nr:hypothetical protein [Acholeplasmataceae bacterium]
MRKLKIRLTSLFIVIILMMSIPTVVYAWMTYVEEKSLVTINAGEIDITTYANEQITIDQIDLIDLTYVDYQNDFILDQSGTLDIIASNLRIDILASEQSVSIKHHIQLIDNSSQVGLLYFIIYEGMNVGEAYTLQSDYHALMSTIILGLTVKEDQLAAIEAYNLDVLDQMAAETLNAGDMLTFQIVFWGDHDEAPDPMIFLDQIYSLSMIIDVINSKGEVA